jgi:hypothetical protein
VEGRLVGRRRGERLDDAQELEDRTRPTVREDQRGGVLARRPDVQEVDRVAVDLGGELGNALIRASTARQSNSCSQWAARASTWSAGTPYRSPVPASTLGRIARRSRSATSSSAACGTSTRKGVISVPGMVSLSS